MFQWFKELLSGKDKTAAPLCKSNSVDCFPGINNPGTLCPNGYCMVHCACYCRGSHT